MKLFLLLYSTAIALIHVLSHPITEEFASFSPNGNLLSEKQLRSKDFREYDETEVSLNTRLLRPHYCHSLKKAECISLNYTTCFGVKIPYSKTSLSLVSEITSLEEAQERLHKWRNSLIHIPKCWAVVQPFLCALYMPKCEDGQVVLPSKEMCEIIQYPCRILHMDNWPREFNCTPYKQERCKNDMRELKFNTTSRCMSPLVQAEQETSYYEGFEGCGVQCHDPFFSDDEREEIRTIVIVGSVLVFFFSVFAVTIFCVVRKSMKIYPASQAIYYMNICFFIASVGYSYQFRPGANDSTICRKDGTLRTSEPSIRENLSCVTSFFIVYYSLIAGLVWLVIFAYAWHSSLDRIEGGKLKDRKDKRVPYYHLVAWSVPLVLTITILALGEVDGDSLLGVCFVGGVNKHYRLIFLLGPLLCSSIGPMLLIKGVVKLILLKINSKEHITSQGNARICENIVRVSIFSAFIAAFGVITFMYHIYDYRHHEEWKKSFRKFIVCQLNISDDGERCRMENRPSVLLVQLQLVALYAMHVNVACWVLTRPTMNTLSKILNKLCKKEIKEEEIFKRHHLVARAYAKREQLLHSDGRISIDLSNSRPDPVGLNFELNSEGSKNLSSSWTKALPRIIRRRGAKPNISSKSISSQRQNSNDSEISISVRRVSVESRRHSLDSTVSLQAVEVTKTVRKRPRNKRNRKERQFKHKSTKRKISSRSSSKASQASSLEAEVLTALNIASFNMPSNNGPNMKRRHAIYDIEESNLKLLNIGQQLWNHGDDNDSNDSTEAESDTEFQNN